MNLTNSTSSNNGKLNNFDLRNFDELIKGLPKSLETRIRLESVLNSINQKLTEGLDSEEILNSIFDSLEQIIPFHRIGIAILENEGKDLRLKWVKSKLPIKHLEREYVASIKESSLKAIIESQRPRIINDLQEYFQKHPHSKSTQLVLEDGIRSNLTCPLILDGIPIGVIFFSSADPYTYADNHIDLFCEIARGLSLVVMHGFLKKTVSNIEMKEKMFRDILHDLNNPLFVIQSVLAIITKKPWFKDLGEDSKKVFEILRRNSETMTRLIESLVYEIKNENTEKTSQAPEINMNIFLNNVLTDAEVMAQRKNIHIILSASENLPRTMKFDSQRVRQALDNLIVNAIKYSNKGSNITIKIHFDEGMHRLNFFVDDEGQGIPEEFLPKLFKGPIQIRSDLSKDELSSGRGLMSVQRILRSLGGGISVKSQLGSGSSFHFWIPVKIT